MLRAKRLTGGINEREIPLKLIKELLLFSP